MEKMEDQVTQVINHTFCYAYLDIGRVDSNEALKWFKASLGEIYPRHNFATIEFNVKERYLMSGRSQVYATLRRQLRGNLIYLDTDIVAYNRIPNNFWNDDFDIGLTDRSDDWPLMPFNGGVVFAKDTPAAQKYMDYHAKACSTSAEGLYRESDWWMDQLSHTLCYYKFQNEIKYKIFDHNLYNFTPDGPQATNAYFVHCKGDRKHLMKQYVAAIRGTDYVTFTE